MYTRGNIGEVYPDVVLPLEWAIGGAASERGWRVGATELGLVTADDLGDEPWVVLGVFGGYAYFNLSIMRLLGVRGPRLSTDAIDAQLLGDTDAPPDKVPAKPNLRATLRLIATAARTMRATAVPRLDDMRACAANQRCAIADRDADDSALWGALTHPPTQAIWTQIIAHHVVNTMQATIAANALADFCERYLSDRVAALSLTTGLGDVISAEPADAMWRLANETSPADYDTRFAAFLERYGHRGPNEFSIHGRDWAAFPHLATTAIDAMRGLDTDRSPAVQVQRMADQREEATRAANAELGRRAKRLEKLVASASLWSRARESSKDLAIWGLQPTRHAYLELARRCAERGGVPDRTGPLMLTEDEFGAYLMDPPSMVPTIEQRRKVYEHLRGLEPPAVFDSAEHSGQAPPLTTWDAKRTPGPTSWHPSGGPVIEGAAGAPGQATGRARVVLDPGDLRGLQPGDVLIAPQTDPAWTPLFVSAAAVIVEVGAAMSHSMIVSRELGIPCVVGVPDATLTIPDGAMVAVDGTAGTVRVL